MARTSLRTAVARATVGAATATSAPRLKLAASNIASPPRSAAVRTGVVLIGTPETTAALAAQLDAAGTGVIPAGAIIIGDANSSNSHPSTLPPLGTLDDLGQLHARYRFRLALITLPAAAAHDLAAAQSAARRLGIPTRTIPPLSDHLTLDVDPSPPLHASTPQRPSASSHWQPPAAIDLAALIGRRPYDLDPAAVAAILAGKRILITGAGGSIGAHIAHVAAQFAPEQLVLMDRSENALFEIDRQLSRRFPKVPRRALLHDVVDAEQTLRHLVHLRPHVVFHAAAHKHVPLMEDHPAHAVTNNVFGTKSIADAAAATGAERFVMISSDKAVNPTSVMGATKRLAELYVHALGTGSGGPGGGASGGGGTRTSMVRFGNVLGSACSVLTIWSTQLAEGGPLTITDPRMTRYFMTIPEAATLVIQSTTLAERPSGSIYVLDMGEPIRILDLARRFALANGLHPRILWETADTLPADLAAEFETAHEPTGPTIDIVFTGARPGEKIHEELAYDTELLQPTSHPGINAWGGKWCRADTPSVTTMVADLSAVRSRCDPDTQAAVLAAIRRHVPELVRSA